MITTYDIFIMLFVSILRYSQIGILIIIIFFRIIFDGGHVMFGVILFGRCSFVSMFSIIFGNGRVIRIGSFGGFLLFGAVIRLFWNLSSSHSTGNLFVKLRLLFHVQPFLVSKACSFNLRQRIVLKPLYFLFRYLYQMNLNEHFFLNLLTKKLIFYCLHFVVVLIVFVAI